MQHLDPSSLVCLRIVVIRGRSPVSEDHLPTCYHTTGRMFNQRSNPRCKYRVLCPFFRPKMTVYGATHAHLVHLCWPLL